MFISQNDLVIRNATANDAAILGKWWRDGKVMAHAGLPLGLAITDEKIASELATDSDETTRRLIIEKNGVPIGEMNYKNMGNSAAEIGIKICEFDQQEKGSGTKLLNMLIGALFGEHGYSKIILNTNLNNLRAQHVYEKLGFRRLGVEIDCWRDQLGKLQSTVNYEMTKSDYAAMCKN